MSLSSDDAFVAPDPEPAAILAELKDRQPEGCFLCRLDELLDTTGDDD